jgi:hypothetical protein
MDNEELKLPDKSDYQLLFQTCIKDLAFVKGQQWKTVHLTLIGLGALLVAIRGGIMREFVACFFVLAVTTTGIIFMIAHQKALIRHREQKKEIVNNMPEIYITLHPIREGNKDIYIFSYMFIGIIAFFALFVLFRI